MGTADVLRQLLSRLTAYPLWEIALELVIIWLLAWAIWRFVEGTRAAGALKGILLILLGFLLLRLLVPTGSFERLSYLGDRFLGFVAIALVIVFQPEIRRAMIRIGEAPIFHQGSSEVDSVIASIVRACELLSKNQFGALIAIEGRVGLRELIERGTSINADVSAELLQAIFWPNSPLHDMGVIVRGNKVLAAGVQFPLAEPADMPDQRLGTRHRAALGLARITDTIIIVVSEETGAISLAHHGRLSRWLTPEGLQSELHRRLKSLSAPPIHDEPQDDHSQEDLSA